MLDNGQTGMDGIGQQRDEYDPFYNDGLDTRTQKRGRAGSNAFEDSMSMKRAKVEIDPALMNLPELSTTQENEHPVVLPDTFPDLMFQTAGSEGDALAGLGTMNGVVESAYTSNNVLDSGCVFDGAGHEDFGMDQLDSAIVQSTGQDGNTQAEKSGTLEEPSSRQDLELGQSQCSFHEDAERFLRTRSLPVVDLVVRIHASCW